jgi:hypothetical protein
MSLLLLLNDAEAVSALRPTVQDVALLERTRTVSAGGAEEITFTDSTRPTASEVSSLIDQALPAILAQLPEGFSEAYYDRARHLVALYTAVLIEGSYFREQLDSGSAGLWRELLTAGLTSLRVEIEAVQGTGQWSVTSVPITTVVAQSSPFLGACELLP